MKALVTGGAGFIGSNLVDALIERGDDGKIYNSYVVAMPDGRQISVPAGFTVTIFADHLQMARFMARGALSDLKDMPEAGRILPEVQDLFKGTLDALNEDLTTEQIARRVGYANAETLRAVEAPIVFWRAIFVIQEATLRKKEWGILAGVP